MRRIFQTIFLLLLIGINSNSFGQVSAYTFAQGAGTNSALPAGYTQHTSGTTDYATYTAIPIGFTFDFNCTSYTTVSIANDGYLVMGNSIFGTTTPISSASENNVISALAADLAGLATGSLRSMTQGTAPNRTFTVQWLNYEEYYDGGKISFQIVLHETTNVIDIFYVTTTAVTTNSTFQTGLSGATNADYNNRTKTTNAAWTASTAGGTNAAVMNAGTTAAKCPDGKFTWTPPVCSGTPNAGVAVASIAAVSCATPTSNLSATGLSTGCGLTYQWESAPAAAGPWTPIALATNTTLSVSPGSNTYYRIVTTCSNGGASNNSSSVLVSSSASPPANDECINAINIVPSASCTYTTYTNSCASASAGIPAPGCASYSGGDVWFKVVVPTCGRLIIDTQTGVISDAGMAIYSGACGSLTLIECDDDDSPNGAMSMIDNSSLTPGSTIYIRVWEYSNDNNGTFGICVRDPLPACSGTPNAGTFTASVNPVTCASPNSLLTGAGLSAGCGISYQWQSAPAAGGPWTDVSGATNTTLSVSPVVNTYYRLKTTCSNGGATNNTPAIQVTTTITPPANDEPCSATLVTVNGDLACGSVTAGTVLCSTNSGIAACVGTGADDDVWYKFVATNTIHNFDLLNIAGSSTNMVHEIFSGVCGSLSSVGCSDPESSQFSGFTIGQTYYVRVHTRVATSGQTTTFNLCIGTPPPPPSNDEPCGALDLTVNNGSCSYQSAVLGTSTTISAGMPAPGCGSLHEDVWYKFTVPASGRIIIDIASSGGPTDMDMAWYTGPSCNNLTAVIECDDSDNATSLNAMICHAGAGCHIPGDCQQNAILTPGTVVYVRLWDYSGTFGPFDICAYDPGAPGVASTCATATVIAGLPFSEAGQTTCCRANTYTAAHGCASAYQGGEDYIYSYTPAANQTIDITLTGTLSYTGIFVTDRCPNAAGVVCVANATSFSGNPTLCGVNLVGGTTYYIMIDTDPTPNCTPFNINITSSSSPTCGLNYSSSVIAFAPDLNAGTNIALPIDDRFTSSYLPFGFTFCFDGFGFSQGLLSSNGYLIFDPISCASNLPSANAAPGNTSDWSISAAIPNTTDAPRNAIMFPWQDIDPSKGGTIKYQTLGTAPNRRFVITLDNVPYYSCNAKKFTGQLKIFETSNTIEIHITNKEVCSGWNGGDAILGLHNYNGTVAVTNAAHNYPTNWTETNTAYQFTSNCGPACIVLPVKLMSFTAESKGNYNQLKWSTSTEVNNDYFVVEASKDLIDFNEVGRVDGGGNSNTVLNYQFNDNTVFEEVIYYRLKQVDFDGAFTYSDIVAVKKINEGEIELYPNPAKEVLNIDINSAKQDVYTIKYINVLGATVQEKIVVNEGSSTYQANEFKQLETGIYFIQVLNQNNEVIKTQKIVKE